MGVEAASDHNLYIKGDLMYQANYRAGLRILTIKDPRESEGSRVLRHRRRTVRTRPASTARGACSRSSRAASIIVSSIEQGLFIVRTGDK